MFKCVNVTLNTLLSNSNWCAIVYDLFIMIYLLLVTKDTKLNYKFKIAGKRRK